MSVDAKKEAFANRLLKLVTDYNKALLVEIDNVGSHHMQKIRKAVRGEAVILCGKNTLIRRALRNNAEQHEAIQAILPLLKGNVALVFTSGNLSAVRSKLLEMKVSAPAKAGSIAPVDVIVPKGNTGMEPTKTSFLQALNIPSKINKGQVEIVNDVHLIKAGDKVGTSEATLLQMLNIKPFFYGVSVKHVYDNGIIYSAKVLEMTDDDILAKFRTGLNRLTCVSLGAKIPTVAAFPHLILNGYKNLLSIALATEISFKQADKLKDAIKNPGAFTAAPQQPAHSEEAEAKPAKPAEPEEPEVEEVEGMGGLFGDD